jgi:hypothetical protein
MADGYGLAVNDEENPEKNWIFRKSGGVPRTSCRQGEHYLPLRPQIGAQTNVISGMEYEDASRSDEISAHEISAQEM